MKKENEKLKNKFIITMIKSLLPYSSDKIFYLNVIINNSIILKTQKFDFKKSNSVEVNQIFDLGEIFKIDTIKFQVQEKNGVFSNFLFKGEFNTLNTTKDEHSASYICYLTNANLEIAAVVYFNYEINSDIIDAFELDRMKLEHERAKEKSSSLDNLKDLMSLNNTESFSKFIKNMDYIKIIQNFMSDLYHWKNPWKTFGMLVIISLSLLFQRLFFITMPMIILYFLVCNKTQMGLYTYKDQRYDNLENMNVIRNTINLINTAVDFYENLIDALQYSDKSLIEDLWVNLIKLFIWNAVFVALGLFRPQLFVVITLWAVFLYKNPSFHAFMNFLYNFIYIKFLINIANTEPVIKLTNITLKFVYTCIPFSLIIHKFIKIQNSTSLKLTNSSKKTTFFETLNEIAPSKTNISIDFSSINDFNQGDTLRFEIFENERWWMLVGWAKNLIMNERPLWSDLTGKIYQDKNSVFLPNNEEYQWMSDWQVIATCNTDLNGWEYGTDFNSEFGPHHNGKFVRRRKWVRYAKKIK
jgi:hypothetical protein